MHAVLMTTLLTCMGHARRVQVATEQPARPRTKSFGSLLLAMQAVASEAVVHNDLARNARTARNIIAMGDGVVERSKYSGYKPSRNIGTAQHTFAGGPFRDRVFPPAQAKGGCTIDPKKTALVCIEYQNEFTTFGGKLHLAVNDVMQETQMLRKSVNVAKACRDKGAKVMHAAIMFKEDASDNPNQGLGILAGCAKDKLFTEGSWNAAYCDAMKPEEGDLIVEGKRGLDAFPESNLEELLKKNNIETVVLCGFLTNCCVESTMRTAYEKGFNVVTLTDCCATTSAEGHKSAIEGTFGMFSKPMVANDFITELNS